VEWLQFLMLLELDIFIIGSIILFVLWLVYHYTIRSGYASLTYQPTKFHEEILARSSRIHGRYLGSPWVCDILSIAFHHFLPFLSQSALHDRRNCHSNVSFAVCRVSSLLVTSCPSSLPFSEAILILIDVSKSKRMMARC